MWVPNLPTFVVSAVASTAGLVCLYKDLRSGSPFDKEVSAEGKTVIVTGANAGIGKEVAREFAKRGAKVFMACRNMDRCEKSRRDIVLETENRYVYCRPCDLANTKSIREFVQRFKSEEPKLDVLVNNAGVMSHAPALTADGFEKNLGVNHLGHFLLTNLLLDTLKASQPSRIVIVSSQSHFKGSINKEDLNHSRHYDYSAAYNQSKLANVLFAEELGRKLLETSVSVSVVDPGLTDTDLAKELPMNKSITGYIIYPIFWPVMKIPRMAAQVVMHAALDKTTAKAKGDYYVDMEKTKPSDKALDFELAQWLWKVSEKWTRLHEHKAALDK